MLDINGSDTVLLLSVIHLIDIVSGNVSEFQNPGFKKLSTKIADKMGYKLVGYKLEIFAVKEACKKIK